MNLLTQTLDKNDIAAKKLKHGAKKAQILLTLCCGFVLSALHFSHYIQ